MHTLTLIHCARSLNSSKLWQPESWTEQIAISWREEIEPNLPPAQCETENGA